MVRAGGTRRRQGIRLQARRRRRPPRRDGARRRQAGGAELDPAAAARERHPGAGSRRRLGHGGSSAALGRAQAARDSVKPTNQSNNSPLSSSANGSGLASAVIVRQRVRPSAGPMTGSGGRSSNRGSIGRKQMF